MDIKEEAFREKQEVMDMLFFAEKRASELADEFTRLEVQIATILLAFIGLFVQPFLAGLTGFSGVLVVLMKFSFVLAVFAIVFSLVMGLLHLKRKERFWDAMHARRVASRAKWAELIKGLTSLEEVRAYVSGIRGADADVVKSPMWTWVLQTTLLGIAIVLLLVLFLIFIVIK